jgi:hypothetical protein
MALVRCILDKFLGVVFHCFPPRLDLSTFAGRWHHVHNDARDPSSGWWKYRRESLPGNFAYMASLFTPLGIFHMPQIYDMGRSPPNEGVLKIFSALKIRWLWPGLNQRSWVLKVDTLPLHTIIKTMAEISL